MSVEQERSRPASVDRNTGEVHGSGSGAGGNNPGEDYDDDADAGGGIEPVGGPRPFDGADHAREDRHQGTSG